MSAHLSEQLADNRAVSLIVRLLVDTDRHILSGQVGGLNADGHSQRWLRFRGSAGLLGAVQAWLASAASDIHETSG
jgi:hypothetical protein